MIRHTLFSKTTLLFFCCIMYWTMASGQHAVYDTVYQITQHDGIVDSVIIVRKKVVLTKHVYYTRPDSKNYSALEIAASPLLLSLNPTGSPDGSAYYSSSFKPDKTNGFSLNGLYHFHTQNTTITTGIRYSKLQQNTSYKVAKQFIEDRHIQVDDTLDVYKTVPEGQTDTVYTYVIEKKDVYFTDTTYKGYSGSYRNSITLIGIPIFIGIHKRYGRVGLAASTGPILSFYIQRKNQLLGDDGEMTKSKSSFQFSPVLSMNASVQLSLFLDQNSAISIQPYFESTVLNTNKSILPSSLAGFQVGIKYFL